MWSMMMLMMFALVLDETCLRLLFYANIIETNPLWKKRRNPTRAYTNPRAKRAYNNRTSFE